MMAKETTEFLAPYRILDLTDEKGVFCTRVLADLGADVIKVEPPGGCSSRAIGPFHKDIPHPERSLFWFAYNTNKRGITLNLESEDGKELLRRLLVTADVVVESFPPGCLDALGLGYSDLCQVRPDVILTSITPFGQDGPYARFKASDLVLWSMGGFAYLTGERHRPPVQISFPQAYLNGALEAAVATMIALHDHEVSGEGQHVDVSIQASVARNLMNAPLFWETSGVNLGRAGPFRVGLSVSTGQRVIWQCKDGEVSFFMWGGLSGARVNRVLVEYMDENGMAPRFMKELDWENFEIATADKELLDELERHVAMFFRTRTKEELFREAIERKMTLYPVQSAADITADTQLEVRDFWKPIDHSELGKELLYPGLPFILSGRTPELKRRAPLIGEHNEEIYMGELDLSREELLRLKELGVV